MKKYIFILFLLCAVPLKANAVCSSVGTTVVYVNGILTSKAQAIKDLQEIRDRYLNSTGDKSVVFRNGYNESHLEGVGDIVQSISQILGSSVSAYDLSTILLQIHPEVQTRKLLLVGHSQGTFYTNAMYDYLLSHGEPREAVSIYNIAAPFYSVGASGAYLNSKNDSLLDLVEKVSGIPLLPRNIDITVQESDKNSEWPGHGITRAYLAGASDRIINDLQLQLNSLKATQASDTGECFTAPDNGLGHKIQSSFWNIADATAAGAKYGFVASKTAMEFTSNALIAAVGGLVSLGQKVATDINISVDGVKNIAEASTPENRAKSFSIISRLYGSSLDEESLEGLLGDQGGAAITAFISPAVAATPKPEETPGEVAGVEIEIPVPVSVPPPTNLIPIPVSPGFGGGGGSTETASTVEEASTPEPIIFTASTTAPTLTVAECSSSLSDSFCLVPSLAVHLAWDDLEAVSYEILLDGATTTINTATEVEISLQDKATSTLLVVAYDSLGTALPSAPIEVFVYTSPVVINEVMWGGIYNDPTKQWIELKNRTPYDLNLSKITLRVENSTDTPFSGSLPASGAGESLAAFYRTDTTFPSGFGSLADFSLLSSAGEKLSLVWSGAEGETILDATPEVSSCGGWCAGELSSSNYASFNVPTPISMERISSHVSGTEVTNWASSDGYVYNANDANGARVVGTPRYTNSTHLPMVGFYCAGSSLVLTPSGGPYEYRPSGNCTSLAGFAGANSPVKAGLYQGAVGSATLVKEIYFSNYTNKSISADYDVGALAAPGDQFFVILWKYSDSVSSSDFMYIGDMLSYIKTGYRLNGTDDTAPFGYQVIYFTYPTL